MTFRLPQGLTNFPQDTGYNALEAEVLAEKALALERAGRQVEHVLATLRESELPMGSEAREHMVDTAAKLVWGFLVQRELCGLHDLERVSIDYAIPSEVLNRAGAIKKRE